MMEQQDFLFKSQQITVKGKKKKKKTANGCDKIMCWSPTRTNIFSSKVILTWDSMGAEKQFFLPKHMYS